MYQNGKRLKWLTPDEAPEALLCRAFSLPNNAEWLGNFTGALGELTYEENWEKYGALTPEETALAYRDLISAANMGSLGECPTRSAPTPYWDEDQDVDDEMPEDDQIWYGYVEDPTAPAEELTLIEQFAIWGMTGFIAFASWEVGFAPAILFNTIAPKFVLAFKRGDVGEVIRIIVNANEAATVDTTPYAEGDVVRVQIAGNPEDETHDVLIVQVS